MKAFEKIISWARNLAARISLREHLPWCGGLLLIVLLFFGKYLVSSTQVVSVIGADVYNQYLHTQSFASAELQQGTLPVWNPYTYGGHPFLADFQSAMLYPLSWVLGMLNPVTALNWWVAIHVFLFGFLTYAWAATRGMRPGAAFVAGVAAMLGGTFYMHVYAGHISNLGSMSWAPLVFMGIDGWLRDKHAGWLIAGATGVALQVYAGHPQYVYYTAIAAGIYSLAHLPWRGGRLRRAALGLLALYPLAGLLCAAQLLPGFCALSEAVRSTGSKFEFAAMFSFTPENVFTLFAPWIYGGDNQTAYWGRCYLWEMQLFFGTGMLALAAYGFAGLERANRWRMGVIIAAVAVLALGANMPIYKLLYNYMPFYSTFRGTSKFVFLIGLFAAMLAGNGFSRLLAGEGRARRLAIACFALAGVVLFAGLLIRTGAVTNAWHRVFHLLSTSKETYFPAGVLEQQPDFKETARALAGNTLIANGLWLLLFGALALGAQYQRRLVWGIGACAIINLALFARTATTGFEAAQAMLMPPQDLARTNPAEYAAKLPDLVKAIRQKQAETPGDPRNDFRTINMVLPSANMTWRTDGIWGYDPSVLKRYAEYIYYSQGVNPDEASQTPPFTKNSHMLNMFRGRLVFSHEPKGGIRVIDMGMPLTRFVIMSNYRVLKNRDEILEAVGSPFFRPGQEVILESEPIPAPEKDTVQYTVRLLAPPSAKSWLIEVVCDKATILLMTDAWAKGWTATTMPGSVQSNYDVMPANYAMRAIPLAQGRHLFRLEYKQPGLSTGVKTSLATTLLLGILIYFPYFRRRLDFSVREMVVHASPGDPDIEVVRCAGCGADDSRLVGEKQVSDGRVYTMVCCKKCGLAYINPRLAQNAILATYRDSAYFQRGEGEVTGYNDYTVDRDLHELFFSSQLDSIERQLPKKGHILDIGCAFGYLLNDARSRGWQTEGIELSGNALRYARDELKLTVHDKPLREVGFAANTFDAVVMDDVIEHYGDPVVEIREVARVLAKGGVFLLHTPNFDSPWRTLMGEKWVHLKPEEHLYYFSPTTLSDMLRKNGFNIIYARTRGKATNLAYIMGVFKKFMPDFGRLLEKTLGRLPMAKWAFTFRGGGMEVLAVKK